MKGDVVERVARADIVIPRELFDFLMGEGEIEDTSFGEMHPSRFGAFWWRAHMRDAERQSAALSPADGELVERVRDKLGPKFKHLAPEVAIEEARHEAMLTAQLDDKCSAEYCFDAGWDARAALSDLGEYRRGVLAAHDAARGTNADLCKSASRAYVLMLEAIRALAKGVGS